MLATDLCDALLIQQVGVRTWKSFLEALGPDAPLPPANAFDHQTILEGLSKTRGSTAFLEALGDLILLATAQGLESIEEEAHKVSYALPKEPDLTAQDFVFQLWIQGRADPELRKILDGALRRMIRVSERRSVHQFYGTPKQTNQPPLKIGRPLKKTLEAWSRDNGRGQYAQVRVTCSKEEVCFWIIYGRRRQALNVIENDGLGVEHKQLALFDFIRFDHETHLLKISTRTPSLVEIYRKSLGLLLFGTENHFGEHPWVDLSPLQSGRDALENINLLQGSNVLQARLKALTWDRGDGDHMKILSTDCFARIEKDGLPLNEGFLIEAKIGLRFEGAGREVIVHLKPPTKVDYLRDRYESLVEPYLAKAGLCRADGYEEEQLEDLWSLYGWHHECHGWQTVCRGDFADWKDRGWLRPLLRENEKVRWFGLDLSTFSMDVARALELEPDITILKDERLIILGRRQDGWHEPTVFILVSRPPIYGPETFDAHIKNLSQGARVVLLVPKERSLESRHIQCSFDWFSLDALLSTAVAAVGDDIVPSRWRAPRNVRLVISKQDGVWLDQVLLDLKVDSAAFKMLLMLANAHPKKVSKEVLCKAIAPERHDTPTKRWKRDFIKSVERSFENEDRLLPEDYKEILKAERSRGYYLSICSAVR